MARAGDELTGRAHVVEERIEIDGATRPNRKSSSPVHCCSRSTSRDPHRSICNTTRGKATRSGIKCSSLKVGATYIARGTEARCLCASACPAVALAKAGVSPESRGARRNGRMLVQRKRRVQRTGPAPHRKPRAESSEPVSGSKAGPALRFTPRRRLADGRASARRYRTRIRFPDRDRARPPSAAAAPAAAVARLPESARGDTTRSPCPLG
jgi:hypothetical protein